MAEYYSKEQLLESGRTTWCDMYDLEDFLTEVPTADVVPKSEVEQLTTLNSQLEAKVFEERKAKSEVVREIFEEIEKAISNLEYRANTPRKTVRVEELKAQVDWVLHEVVPKTIAELKKKYTEGKT